MNIKRINLNYLRGLYDFLFGMTDEELEEFDINSSDRRQLLFKEMKATFSRFGPIARNNIVDGLDFILSNVNENELWRKAIPHDLPINHVDDRKKFLEEIIFALIQEKPCPIERDDVSLIDEIGPNGLDYLQ